MPETTQNRWEEEDMKRQRLSEPSGWLHLTSNDHAQLLVDALIDGYPDSFNKTELADFAGVSRDTVYDHIELLEELDVAEDVNRGKQTRYRFDPDSDVSDAILAVDAAVQSAQEMDENC
ncbi:winged helix-turn-helix domain-containing protein [Halobaculum sp. MBLA0143]|uniref:winged helix-turn-helix domain-containing protein n=1 Tax=Halobaculum sp. MBLA0143 TaxID=3079933 RepID=UPI0035249DBE